MSNTETGNANTQTVKGLYEAFGKGDLPSIMAKLSDNVRWDNSAVASNECPWNGNFSTAANVPAFFEAIGGNLDFSVFNPHTFVASGNHVIALLRIESTIRKNGVKNANDAVHVWTFGDDGKVVEYRHFNDTAQELAAWRS